MVVEEARSSIRPWQSLEGKVVLVTGVSSGIGHDLCLDLAKAGCRVLTVAWSIDRLKSLCDEINGRGSAASSSSSSAPGTPAARAVAVELVMSAEGSEIEAAVKKAWDAFGRIDALLNNTGVRGSVNSPLDWPEDEWHNNLSTNLTSSWLVSKYVCRLMRDAKQKGSGFIANVQMC